MSGVEDASSVVTVFRPPAMDASVGRDAVPPYRQNAFNALPKTDRRKKLTGRKVNFCVFGGISVPSVVFNSRNLRFLFAGLNRYPVSTLALFRV